MKIGVIGGTGFIGSRVVALGREAGHEMVTFSRQPKGGMRLFAADATPDLSGLDAVVNLVGESVMGRWTGAKKRRILESRVHATNRVVEALAKKGAPRILVNASAVGFYGDTGGTPRDEGSPPGTGFLAEVCRAWESAAAPAEKLGARVVLARPGFVIGHGGAMKLILPVFSLGLGGRLGGGRQWMSGAHVDDVAGMMLWAVGNEGVRGPVNTVFPEAFRNGEFTSALARTLERPAVLPVPAFAMKVALGELSQVMLGDVRVSPRVARENGYRYRYPTLERALREVAR